MVDIADRLIEILSKERGEIVPALLPDGRKFDLYRALVNTRMPKEASGEYLALEDEYLRSVLKSKTITDIDGLTAFAPDIYLWRGDITTLKCDGIVNAANSQLLGCFCPCHNCIDNAIHTFAGVRLRLECAEIMREQGHEEPTGRAKITNAYNLPCKYVLHTVGPIVCGALTRRHEKQLADCYRACLELADEKGLQSLAFCCISTGEFHFPNERAAEIAVRTVKDYKKRTQSNIKVIFDVFKELDYEIYARSLGADIRG